MVRRMCKEDLDAVEEIEQLSFSVPWSRSMLTQGFLSALDHYLIIEKEGQPAGYINFRFLAGEGEIERIAVHPRFRGQGLGRKLMEAMEEYGESRGVTDFTLEVRSSNEKAINLYESCGFVKEAVRKGYYRHPSEDAIIMWRRGL